MKRLLAFILCVVLLCATTVIASAEEGSADAVEVETTVTENLPSADESATEGENSASETKPMTDIIVDYIKSHVEELSVIGTLILTVFYEIRKHKKLNGSIGTLNNNAIAVAENSAATIKKALDEVKDIANVVHEYKDEFATLLGEVRKSAEEKQSLETTLAHVETFLKTAKLATLELSNEVAELLVLANIPNSKKEELYSRHTKAVHDLENVEEVISNDGQEA